MTSRKLVLLVFALAALLAISLTRHFPSTVSAANEPDALKGFRELHPIDAHAHIFQTDARFQKMLERDNLTLLNILVVDDSWKPRNQLQPQIDDAWKLVQSSKGHVAFCTTFDGYKFNSPSFTQDSIHQLDRDFKNGAIAVKIWKNFGMEIKDSNGNYVLPDDPKLQPIFED